MPSEIQTIRLPLPLKLGSVNCYLIKTDCGCILFDTGGSNRRCDLEEGLESAGCRLGDLNLIILTHGDFDHCGNAAYLRCKFGTQIAMHQEDSGMVEHGDMFWNRGKPNIIIGTLGGLFFRLSEADRFKPDIYLDDGDVLSDYGLDAKVLSLPGHSKGSIAILTASGDLIVGDLLENTNQPALNSIMDELTTANASVGKLEGYPIKTIYPGHGEPFPMEVLYQNQRKK